MVSSVSCIYGLGEPEDFAALAVSLRTGAEINRDELLRKLINSRYERNDGRYYRDGRYWRNHGEWRSYQNRRDRDRDRDYRYDRRW